MIQATVTINLPEGEINDVEYNDASLDAILASILAAYPSATSMVMVVNLDHERRENEAMSKA